MKTSNAIGIAAAATLLTALELGLAATLLSVRPEAVEQPVAQVQEQRSGYVLEPVEVVALIE